MFPAADSDGAREGEVLAERVEALAAWIRDLDARVGAAEAATSDPKAAKELRKAVEAVAKLDPKLEERLTHRVDVLKDRFAMLAETVGTTSASLAARDGEIAGLRRALETESSRVETLAAGLEKGGSPSKDVDRLRKEVAALASDKSRSRGADKVPGKLEILEQRLDTLATTTATTAAELASRDGELAALRRQVADETASVQAALGEVRAAIDPAPLAELRLNVKELADRTKALGRQSRQGIDGLVAQLTTVTDQLASLARELTTTSQDLSTADRGLTELRASVDEETTRLDAHVTSVEQVLGGVTERLSSLDDLASRDSVAALEQTLGGVSHAVEGASARLEELAQAVAETGQGYADREVELAALSRAFDEGRTKVESLVRDLSEALATMPEPGPDPEQEARLQELSRELEDQGRAVAAAVGSLASREQELAELRTEVRVLARAEALVDVEERLQAVATQVEGLGQRLLDLDATGADARKQASATDAELARRVEQVAEEQVSFAAELARAQESSTVEHESLAAGARLLDERVRNLAEGLDALSRAAEESVRSDVERDERLLDLDGRFEDARAKAVGLAAEVQSELEALAQRVPGTEHEARLEALDQRIDSLDRTLLELAGAREATAGAQAELARELAALRSGVDEETGRLDTHVARIEQALEALPDRTLAAALEGRVHGLAEAVEATSGRLEELSAEVAGATRGYEERELELAAAARAFDESRSGVETLASEVRTEVNELVRAAQAERDEGLGALAGELEDLRARLAELDRVEGEHAASTARLEAALASSADERESLAAGARLLEERMHGIAEAIAAVGAADPELEARLQELGVQVADGKQRVANLTTDLQGALDSLSARLDGLGADVETAAAGRADGEREVAELAQRFEQASATVDSLVGDLRQALEDAQPDSELEGSVELLGQRLDTLAAAVEARLANKETDVVLGKVLLRLDAIERAQQSLTTELGAAATSTGASEEVVAELRLLVENTRARIELLELQAKPSDTHVEQQPAQVVSIRGSEG